MVREEKTMTRGEAVDFLEKCRWWFEPFTSEKEKWNEALDVAIEALTQDSRKFTQDLISRQDAFRTYQVKVCHGVACSECQMIEADGTCRIEAWLKDLSSADRPKGKWLSGDCKGAHCSVCDEYTPFTTAGRSYPFCPNCGAKMGGGPND